ncbi:MAG TPA: hypothetical protein VGB74_02410 [Actinoplanes sp.]
MTTGPLAQTDVVVLDYLAALWAQSDDLDPELRDELMTTVADYIAVRRNAPAGPIEDANELLSRLGPPEDLVAACRRGRMPPHLRLPALIAPPVPALRAARGGGAEFTAVGLLTAGALVLPGVAPIAGILLATGSPHWTGGQKVVGWTLTVGSATLGLLLAILFGMGLAESALPLFVLYMASSAGSVAAGVTLLSHLRRPGQAG